MRYKFGAWILCFLVSVIGAARANAWDTNVTARVTVIEASYAPNSVPFQIDQAFGTCPLGSFLTFQAMGATVAEKAASAAGAMSALVTAQATKNRVVVFGISANCTIQNIWLLKD